MVSSPYLEGMSACGEEIIFNSLGVCRNET